MLQVDSGLVLGVGGSNAPGCLATVHPWPLRHPSEMGAGLSGGDGLGQMFSFRGPSLRLARRLRVVGSLHPRAKADGGRFSAALQVEVGLREAMP